jgi:hypothetical protein
MTTDRQKMIDFISSQLPDGEATLMLASGPEGYVMAHIEVCGDDLEIASNCPEWVTVREIYEHLCWEAMLDLEKKAWLHGHVLSSRVADLENRLQTFVAIGNQAPYRFQNFGDSWLVHFTVAGDLRLGIVEDHRGLQHYAMLLAHQDRAIKSIQLDGRDDTETMTIITSERNRRAERQSGSLTVDTLTKAFELLKERYAAAKERGNSEEMDGAQKDIDRFTKQIGSDEKAFKRYVFQEEPDDGLERTIHRTVSTAMRRARQILRDKKMGECADFLGVAVKPEGYGFAYRPQPGFRPEWLL